MSDDERDAPSPAELFEQFFGPSIFHPWSRALLEHAEPRAGDRVLDLACATGIVARHVAPIVGDQGRVVGVDISADMLAVADARAAREGVRCEWRQGDATSLDLPDDAFDLVVCQQGLQFFPDPARALAEIARVLRPGGRLALTVWQPLERQPVYAALFEAEARHLGVSLDAVAKPFSFGGADRLRSLLTQAGFEEVDVREQALQAEFGDPDRFVALTVLAAAAVLPDLVPDDAEGRRALIEAITESSQEVLQRYRQNDRLRFEMPSHVAVCQAPGGSTAPGERG